jgi:hypothetical protein
MEHPQKAQALGAIRAHLEQNGSKNWGALRSQLDFIGPNTFWRWIRETKAQIAPELLCGSPRRRRGEPRFDFLSAYHGLWCDAIMLRTHALHSDGNIRCPALLDRAIRVRLKLLRQGLELEARILSAAAQRAFYDGLVAEIAAESPALHERLMSRLRDFSRQWDAKPEGEARQVDA